MSEERPDNPNEEPKPARRKRAAASGDAAPKPPTARKRAKPPVEDALPAQTPVEGTPAPPPGPTPTPSPTPPEPAAPPTRVRVRRKPPTPKPVAPEPVAPPPQAEVAAPASPPPAAAPVAQTPPPRPPAEPTLPAPPRPIPKELFQPTQPPPLPAAPAPPPKSGHRLDKGMLASGGSYFNVMGQGNPRQKPEMLDALRMAAGLNVPKTPPPAGVRPPPREDRPNSAIGPESTRASATARPVSPVARPTRPTSSASPTQPTPTPPGAPIAARPIIAAPPARPPRTVSVGPVRIRVPRPRHILAVAIIVSVLLHFSIGYALHNRTLGRVEVGDDTEFFSITRSEDVIVPDAADADAGPAAPSPDKPPTASDLSAALLVASDPKQAPNSVARATPAAPPTPIDMSHLERRPASELNRNNPVGPGEGPLAPGAAAGTTGNAGAGVGLPDAVASKILSGPKIDLPYVEGGSGTPIDPVQAGAGGGGGGGSSTDAAMRLLQSTGTTGGRTPGGAFAPRSIDTGPAERRGPAASTSTPLDLTKLADGTKLEIPEHLDDDFDYSVHAYRPASSANGAGPSYFRVDITGKRTLKKLQTMPKDVIFLLDTSGSVSQEWVNAMTAGVRNSLTSLNPGDRFNIVFFSDKPHFFSADRIQPATQDNLDAADKYLRTAKSGGMTDVNQAMGRLLVRDTDVARVYDLVLISDGVPTKGVMDTRDLINLITKGNDLTTSIYCVGVGNPQNHELLNYMSYRNRGFSVFADKPGDAAKVIPGLMNRLRYPIIKDVRLGAAGVELSRAFPHDLPTIHQGETFSVFGEFDTAGAGPFTLRMTGRSGGQLVDFSFTRDLSNAPPGTYDIATQWAFWKLHHLYSEQLRTGNSGEITEQINQLKRDFGVKTMP